MAKEYHSLSRFQHVTIVNSHDLRGLEVNFFCHVLDYADNSCKANIEKKELSKNEKLEVNKQNFSQKSSMKDPFKLETALEDIVIAAFEKRKLIMNSNGIQSSIRRSKQIHLWIEMVRSAFNERNLTIDKKV